MLRSRSIAASPPPPATVAATVAAVAAAAVAAATSPTLTVASSSSPRATSALVVDRHAMVVRSPSSLAQPQPDNDNGAAAPPRSRTRSHDPLVVVTSPAIAASHDARIDVRPPSVLVHTPQRLPSPQLRTASSSSSSPTLPSSSSSSSSLALSSSDTYALTWWERLEDRLYADRRAQVCGLIVFTTVLAAIALLVVPAVLSFVFNVVDRIEPTPTVAVLCFFGIVIFVNPILLGYGLSVMVTAVLFGWRALPIVYSASVVGGCVWFLIARRLQHAYGWDVLRWLHARDSDNVDSALAPSLSPSSSSSSLSSASHVTLQRDSIDLRVDDFTATPSSSDSSAAPQSSARNVTRPTTTTTATTSIAGSSTATSSVTLMLARGVRVLRHHSFFYATLLQLSFVPFGVVTCAMASQTTLPFRLYLYATLVSRVKLVNYVWLATTAHNLRTLWSSKRAITAQDVASIAVSVTCSLVAVASLAYYVRSELSAYEPIDEPSRVSTASRSDDEQQQQRQQQDDQENEEGVEEVHGEEDEADDVSKGGANPRRSKRSCDSSSPSSTTRRSTTRSTRTRHGVAPSSSSSSSSSASSALPLPDEDQFDDAIALGEAGELDL